MFRNWIIKRYQIKLFKRRYKRIMKYKHKAYMEMTNADRSALLPILDKELMRLYAECERYDIPLIEVIG